MAGKIITLKYKGKCRDCGAELPVGSKARWYGRGIVYGLDCHSKNKSVTKFYSPATGGYIYENEKGRCEDAPCCGCCGDERTIQFRNGDVYFG